MVASVVVVDKREGAPPQARRLAAGGQVVRVSGGCSWGVVRDGGGGARRGSAPGAHFGRGGGRWGW